MARPSFRQESEPDAWYEEWSDGVLLRTPYSESFVEALKAMIPYYARQWVPSEMVWAIHGPHHAATAVNLALLFYPEMAPRRDRRGHFRPESAASEALEKEEPMS